MPENGGGKQHCERCEHCHAPARTSSPHIASSSSVTQGAATRGLGLAYRSHSRCCTGPSHLNGAGGEQHCERCEHCHARAWTLSSHISSSSPMTQAAATPSRGPRSGLPTTFALLYWTFSPNGANGPQHLVSAADDTGEQVVASWIARSVFYHQVGLGSLYSARESLYYGPHLLFACMH